MNDVVAQRLRQIGIEMAEPSGGPGRVSPAGAPAKASSPKGVPAPVQLPTLSKEQQDVVDAAVDGQDVIVDATVGSGKTSTIMALCNEMGGDRKILYLTYSKLLKKDAQRRVRGARVQNYHGIVYPSLLRANIRAGISESVRAFNDNFRELAKGFDRYDVVVVDEYQDINEEYAELIKNVVSLNPMMQLVFVGDCEQKIHANSTLDAQRFVREITTGAVSLPMTASFRMGPDMGRLLGEAWNKPVVGVNDAQVVREMSHDEAVAYMGHVAPGDLLVLGKRNNGYALRALNELERTLPGQFNKNTVYASIKDRGESGEYSDDTAIFTTFDSAKGLERPVTFVYDMDPEYYNMRMRLAPTDPEVIRNVFLVAASRGKGEIVFVHNVENSGTAKVATQLAMADSFADAQQIASRHDVDFTKHEKKRVGWVPVTSFLKLPGKTLPKWSRGVNASSCFDFTYAENVVSALDLVAVEELEAPGDEIEIAGLDGMIDLSPAIGQYAELSYFQNTEVRFPVDMDFSEIEEYKDLLKVRTKSGLRSAWDDALFMTAMGTAQKRYLAQVTNVVSTQAQDALEARLSAHLPDTAETQVGRELRGAAHSKRPRASTDFNIKGVFDVLHEGIVWELKFVSELRPEHVLQAALYQVMEDCPYTILFNIRTGQMLKVSVPDRDLFLNAVVLCVSKQAFQMFQEK